MRIRKLLASALVATMAISLVACGGSEPDAGNGGEAAGTEGAGEATEGVEQVLNYATNSIVVGMNPILDTTAPDNRAHNMIQEPLVRERTAEGNTSEIVAGCASEWSVSEDGLTYTFTIPEDRMWSDGVRITANDFEYTLKLMADPTTAAANAWLYDGMIIGFTDALYNGGDPDAIGVSCPDENTLVMEIEYAASYLPELVSALYPVRQDKYEEWAGTYGTSPETTLYSGAFVVESWNQNTEMVLVPNEHYWKADEVSLTKLNFKVIQESTTAVQAYINGEIDIVSTADPDWGSMIDSAGESQKYVVPDMAPEFIMTNTENQYLSNAKIRQALSISFDRQAMIDTVWNGQGLAIESLMPDTTMIGDKTYTELVGGENYFVSSMQAENSDAKALLEEGLEELGLSADASQVTLRYASRGTDESSKKMAEYYKQVWEEALGITIEIEMMEWNIMWEKIDEGDYDLAIGGWGPYYNEPSGLLSLFDKDNGYFNSSKTGWDDDSATKYQALLQEAKTITDQQALADIYLEAEALLVGSGIIFPEYLNMSSTYVNNSVGGYYVSTNGETDWSQVYKQ